MAQKKPTGRPGQVVSYRASVNFSSSLVPWSKATVNDPPTIFLIGGKFLKKL